MRIPLSLAGDCAAVCLRDDLTGHPPLSLSNDFRIEQVAEWTQNSIDVSAMLKASAAVIWSSRHALANRSDWFCQIDLVSMQADMRDVHLRQWPMNDLSDDDSAVTQGAIEDCLASDPDARLRQWSLHRWSPSQWIVRAAASDSIDVSVEHPAGLLDAPLRHHRATGADSRLWQRLTTELQMMMHASIVNTARLEQGRLPVNGIWLYGGGLLPSATRVETLPPLCGHNDWAVGLWQLLTGKLSAPIHDDGRLLQGGMVHGAVASALLVERIKHTLSSGPVREVRLLMPSRTLRIRRQHWLRRWGRRLGLSLRPRVDD